MRFHVTMGVFISAFYFQWAVADTMVSGEEIIVTAARSAQTADEALASVSVINRKDIENSQAATVTELLRLEAGIDIARTGGPGQQTSLFLRGGNSDHALVLIDGVRVSSGTTGSFPWEKISLQQIERIEIVRGPRSVLYGSEAISGVIQIFTRRSDRATARLDLGSFGTHGASAATSFGDKLKMHLSADYRAATGFSATNPNSGGSYDPDNDGYTIRSISVGARSRLSDKSNVDFSLWTTRSSDEFDSGTHKSANQIARFRLTTTQSENWSHTLILGNIVDDLTTASAFPSRIITRRDTAEWQHDLSLGKATTVTAGLSYANENASNDSAPFNNQIANTGFFADWRYAAGANDLELGLRRDIHSAFGQHDTGQIAWGRKFSRQWRLFASYGTAFKAPDQNELYHPGFGGWFAGNSALLPETSVSSEIGLRFRKDKNVSAKASIYTTEVTNLIAYQGTNNQAINISRTRLQGIETEYSHRFGKWDTRTNLTLQSAKDVSANSNLLRRPAAKLSLKLNRRLKRRGNLGVEILAVSNHVDFDNISFSTIDVPGYAIVNLSMRRSLSKNWVFEGRLENLLDKRYEIVSGYNTVPRSILVALRYVTSD
ncbi:MAG: TonB-dependent receptor [Acidiferrobacterales bacterium]